MLDKTPKVLEIMRNHLPKSNHSHRAMLEPCCTTTSQPPWTSPPTPLLQVEEALQRSWSDCQVARRIPPNFVWGPALSNVKEVRGRRSTCAVKSRGSGGRAPSGGLGGNAPGRKFSQGHEKGRIAQRQRPTVLCRRTNTCIDAHNPTLSQRSMRLLPRSTH